MRWLIPAPQGIYDETQLRTLPKMSRAFGLGYYLASFHPQFRSTLFRHSYAQLGEPSLLVPGTCATSTRPDSIISHVLILKGIFRRRLQGVLVWPAYVPMLM